MTAALVAVAVLAVAVCGALADGTRRTRRYGMGRETAWVVAVVLAAVVAVGVLAAVAVAVA